MNRSNNARYFWGAFASAGCIILLVCGIVMVDYQTARIGFGRTEPMILVEVLPDQKTSLHFHALGIQSQWDITPFVQWVQYAEDATVAAIEAGQKLLEGIPLQKPYK